MLTLGTVVHPRAVLDGRVAPLKIGDNCIVEERAVLRAHGGGLTIGDGNLFEVDCVVEASDIGNCNQFEPRCVVARGASICNFCTIGAACRVDGASITDRTVVFGEHATRRTWSGEGVAQQLALHAKHLQYLRDTLPHAHKLRLVR